MSIFLVDRDRPTHAGSHATTRATTHTGSHAATHAAKFKNTAFHSAHHPVMADFIPAPWLGNPHLQTISRSNVFRVRPLHVPERVQVETPDGDAVHLDVVEAARRDRGVAVRMGFDRDRGGVKTKGLGSDGGGPLDVADGGPDCGPVVLLLHGLEGSSDRPYVVSMVNHLVGEGFSTVAMNHRGCGGQVARTPITYHAGYITDVERVIVWMRDRFPGRRLHVVGFSLGGCILLNLLARSREADSIHSSVSVSSPIRLGDSSIALQSGIGKLYEWYFIRSLRKKTLEMQQRFPDYPAFTGRTLLEFDEQVTSQVNGYTSATDYYESNSPIGFLESLQHTVLLVHAADDPICPWRPDDPLHERLQQHPSVRVRLTQRGGHVAFLSSPPGWLERCVSRYLKGEDRR